MLTGLREQETWPNYEVVGFQASFNDWSIPRLCRLLLCTLPFSPCYSSIYPSYHTSSSNYLGVPHLRPSISVCHTMLFSHLGVSCLCLSIPKYQPALPLLSSSYCMSFSPPLLLLLVSHELFSVERIFFLSPLDATKPPSCILPLHTMFPLRTPQMVDVESPTVPRLPAVSLCRSSLTAFMMPPVRLPPQASTTSCLLTASLTSPWSAKGTQCVSLPPSSTLSPKVPTSLTHTVESPAPPPCRKLPIPWFLPLTVVAVSPVSPKPTLRAWCSAAQPTNHHPFGLGVFQDTGTLSNSTPSLSTLSSPYPPSILNSISSHLSSISTSLRWNLFSVDLWHLYNWLCLNILSTIMCIPHWSHHGNGSGPSCNMATFDFQCRSMEFSLSLPRGFSVARHPSAGHSTNFIICGNDTL